MSFVAAEHHLGVSRTARYWTLGNTAAGMREVWFVCHGYGQLAGRFIRRFTSIASAERCVLAPEALSRFYLDGTGMHGPDSPVGASWMTREDRLNEIEDYIAYLDALHDRVVAGRNVRVVALGFSQGVSTVARWAARTSRAIGHVVLWSGGWPPELTPGATLFGKARLTIVIGEADPAMSAPAADTLIARLGAAGLKTARISHAGGHEVTEDALAALLARLRMDSGM
jgi:predicted esterase